MLDGGCAEMLMSCAVKNEARSVKGKKVLAMEAFGQGLKQILTILVNNTGNDSSNLVLRQEQCIMKHSNAGFKSKLIFPLFLYPI